MFPRNSFALQVKSSADEIDATGKIEYLEKLELPFFVGVVDQSSLRLSIYSGEYLPVFFAHYGIPHDLKLSLESTPITFDNYCIIRSEGKYTLRMPHVLNLEAVDDPGSRADKMQILFPLCSRTLQNISSRRTQEYVFQLGDGRAAIFAGPGSVTTFRNNFDYRLAEAFRNFEWICRNRSREFDAAEFEVLEHCYRELKSIRPIPMLLTAAYEAVKLRLPEQLQESR